MAGSSHFPFLYGIVLLHTKMRLVRDSYSKEEKRHKRERKMKKKKLRIRQKEEMRENA
jgi:hypothetical protein